MSEITTESSDDTLILEYQLEAPPEKVWRAISIPEFREQWLPSDALIESTPIFTVQNKEQHYRMRDEDFPLLESVVVFQVIPHGENHSILRITHKVSIIATTPCSRAANDASLWLALAA
ncbi:SRPBCC family protein [Paenalcaligenes sp. Me131]|uniref:SRPBCC family protein n=1 Tax=Paenalcaligenes sp. Me131 TaxID=3392636 RepID=UPI003D2E7DE4